MIVSLVFQAFSGFLNSFATSVLIEVAQNSFEVFEERIGTLQFQPGG